MIRIANSNTCLKFWSKGSFELAGEPEPEPKERTVTVSTFTDWLRFTAAGIKVFENIKLKEQRAAKTGQGFRFLWPCIVNIRWREGTNKMQLIRCLLSNFLSQHVSGIIMPIIRRIRPCPTACGVLPECVGCVQCTQLTTQLYKTTANHSFKVYCLISSSYLQEFVHRHLLWLDNV